MSFILKALKKLEDEKAARKGGEVDLPGALLRADAAPAQGRPVRWWLIIIVFAAGSGLTALLVQHRPGASTASRIESPPPAVSPPSEAPTPPAPQPAVVVEAPSPLASASAPAGPAPSGTSGTRRRLHGVGRKAAAPEQAERTTTPVPAVSASNGLRVNGIALQDDPDESVAVINGALVKRGMTVGEMRVEEILPDRVRLSGPGGTVEVHLSR